MIFKCNFYTFTLSVNVHTFPGKKGHRYCITQIAESIIRFFGISTKKKPDQLTDRLPNYLAPGMACRNLLITVGLCAPVKPVDIGLNVKVGATCLYQRLSGRINNCIQRKRVCIEH